MFYKKFSSIDYVPNTLIIDLNIIKICQYKCPYCYSKNNGQIMKKDKFEQFIRKLKTCKYKIKIRLLGGEPTLHPHLNYFLNELYKLDNVSNVQIITNGYKKLNNLPLNKKLSILFSFHPSESSGERIIDNINLLNDKIQLFLTYPLLKRYSQQINSFIQKIDKNIGISPTVILIKGRPIYQSTDSKYDNFYQFKDGNNLITTSLGINKSNFKNYKCESTYLNVDTNFVTALSCYKDVNLLNSNFLKEYIIETHKCEFDHCYCDCLLGQLKTY